MTRPKDGVRVCSCGCGRSIDHLHPAAQPLSECRIRRTAERRRQFRSPSPMRHLVKSAHDGEPRQRQHLCDLCGSMPWRVIGERCSGCGLRSGEERIERGTILSSSAGTAIRAAAMHGDRLDPARVRPSRAKGAA